MKKRMKKRMRKKKKAKMNEEKKLDLSVWEEKKWIEKTENVKEEQSNSNWN